MLRRKTLQFILNIFPPLFFNRIILKEVSEDYTYMRVKLMKSILNINFSQYRLATDYYVNDSPENEVKKMYNAKKAEIESMRDVSSFAMAMLMFATVILIGFIISLVSSLVLNKK